MRIDTKPLKQAANKMEECTTRTLILSLPDEMTREELVSKMDLILLLLGGTKKGDET